MYITADSFDRLPGFAPVGAQIAVQNPRLQRLLPDPISISRITFSRFGCISRYPFTHQSSPFISDVRVLCRSKSLWSSDRHYVILYWTLRQ